MNYIQLAQEDGQVFHLINMTQIGFLMKRAMMRFIIIVLNPVMGLAFKSYSMKKIKRDSVINYLMDQP